MSNELVDEKRQTVSEQQETRCTMRKRSRQDIRQDILNATLDEIEVQGPDFHMDDLARKMCISKRTARCVSARGHYTNIFHQNKKSSRKH